jgi:protein-tyrosine phosphatase
MDELVVEPWAPGPGVIEMPDGTRFRGRGVRRPSPDGEAPTHGVYLLRRPPAAMPWDAQWIRCPDFRVPSNKLDAARVLAEAHRRAETGRVEIGCGGGRGRTGTALACIAIIAGVAAAEAVQFVRDGYDRHAVETPFQRRFVLSFGAYLARV